MKHDSFIQKYQKQHGIAPKPVMAVVKSVKRIYRKRGEQDELRFTGEDVVWIVKRYLDREQSYKTLRDLIANCHEMRTKEWRKKYKLERPKRIVYGSKDFDIRIDENGRPYDASKELPETKGSPLEGGKVL